MQAAVDIVHQSPHPKNKIAATIAKDDWNFSCVNHWPAAIENTIGREPDIGNSSGTIHAETACIFEAMRQGNATKNASIFITDPPCPNCMKNMAEAGISKLYIDHKGFDKDWAKRRGMSFENMSMRIADKAGIDVFEIYRKEERYEIISKHASNYKPAIENPPIINDQIDFNDCDNMPFASARANDLNGEALSILVSSHPTVGFTTEDIEKQRGKYSFIIQPLNRLLIIAAKEGLSLDPTSLISSRNPTSRELVNFIGAGFNTLKILDLNTSRDEFGPIALKHLQEHNLLMLS